MDTSTWTIVFAIMAILLATTVVVTAIILTDKLSAYKKDAEFLQKQRKERGLKAALILSSLSPHREWLRYMAKRAKERDVARGDFERVADMVEFLWDTLYFSGNDETMKTMKFTREFLTELFPGKDLARPIE